MAEGRLTPKSVFCLVGSYALAFALMILGSVVAGSSRLLSRQSLTAP